MMTPGRAEQGATHGAAERRREQAGEAGDRSGRQGGADAHGGHDAHAGPEGHRGHDAGGAFPGGFGVPPYGVPPFAMPPFAMPPYAVPPFAMPPYAMPFPGTPPFAGPYGMSPAMHPGAAQQPTWDPSRMGLPFSACAATSSSLPWLAIWWASLTSWFTSWFVWPGFAWLFSPFATVPGSATADQTMRFAETRAYFWHHYFQSMAALARQAASACYAAAGAPAGTRNLVDMAQLKEALKSLPEPQADMVMHAVHMLQAMELRPKPPAGPDW